MALDLLLGVVGLVHSLLEGLVDCIELIPNVRRGFFQQVISDVYVLVRLDSLGHTALDIVLGESCPRLWR